MSQTAHLRQKQSTTQTRNADLQIRKLPDGLLSCRLPPSLHLSLSLPLFALLMAFGCNCTCFVFTRLQLLIALKLKQSHKKWKVIFGTQSKFHSLETSFLQFILLSLTEQSIADGSFPIDSEATDQENYFKWFSPLPSPQHWPL